VAACRKCDAHKKGDLGFCELPFIARLPCCDVPLLAYQPYIGIWRNRLRNIYNIPENTTSVNRNNAGMLMSDNIWTFITENQVF
jgi:hypothetical protein